MSANIKINIVAPGDPTPIDPVVPNTGLFTHGIGTPEVTILVSVVLILAIAGIVLATYTYRKHKKTGKATKLVRIVEQTKTIIKNKKRTTAGLAALSLLVSACTFIALAKNGVNATDTDNQTEDEAGLTVDVSDEDFTIEVGDEPVFAVLPVEVTVAEATPAGYTLTAYTDSTDLVSTTDSSKVIPIVAAEEGELVALAEDTYGLALDNEPTSKDDAIYTLLSTAADNPTFITDKNYKATEANDTTTIYYGFYITPNTPYGTYESSDIHYDATTNSSKVIFNGNGLYFNNNPEQTTNDVEYITGITEKTAKYSHTPNMDDEGVVSENVPFGTQVNEVMSIPGASSLHIEYSYRGGLFPNYGNYLGGYASFWEGSHPDYSPNNDYTLGVQSCGASEVKDGRYYSDNNSELTTVECAILGDTVTFGYWAQGGGPGSYAAPYGYYAIVTGYDTDGNIIYLPGNTQVGGEYKDPSQDLPYIFLGWNEDKDATTAAYESKNDIELNLSLIKGKTTELYAIWQHATHITFDGNGSTSGEIPDKLLAPGKGTNLCGYYYTRDGYIFNNWNTRPDGSGESYGQCYWYTAPADQSVELNLYAQWIPATTIIYDGNGGEGNGPTQTIRAGETSSIYGNWGYFNKDGYIFSHWNTKSDGSGETYYEGYQFTASDQSITITLYAQWIPATTIIYDGNGGEGNGPTQTIRAGETSSIYGNWGYFNKDGYIFSHWNTKSDGSGETYYEGYQFTASDQSTTITLYAQWIDGAILDTGAIVNAKFKRLAGNSSASYSTQDTNVTTIARASTLPVDFAPTDDNTISINGSITPVYAWYDTDTTTIYYYTESDEIIMNSDSSHMFYNFTSLSDATPIADWDTTYVTNMSWMFVSVGSNSTTFSLDLSSWDTSKVTNMSYMFLHVGSNSTTFSLDLSSWDTSKVTNMSYMFVNAGYNSATFSLDLSSWDTSNVTDMHGMFNSAGYNSTTFSLDLSSWDTSKVTNMSGMFVNAGSNATTWSIGDLSSWDTSNVTNMSEMFAFAGSNATTWSIGDLSSWDTSKVTNMSAMFCYAGSNATTWSVGDLFSWDTTNVTDMYRMFDSAGRNATTFSLDLSSWDTSNVTNMSYMFHSAGSNATTWSVTIPPKTGDINNTTSAFYGQDSSIYANPSYNRFFTLAAQTNPNTTNTTGSLNSVNNAGSPNQDNSSGNRSAYTTEDVEEIENTENDDSTSSDTTSTPSQQEPLGEHQSSATVNTEDTDIVIPILIAASVALGTSALGLLIYESRRREDE